VSYSAPVASVAPDSADAADSVDSAPVAPDSADAADSAPVPPDSADAADSASLADYSSDIAILSDKAQLEEMKNALAFVEALRNASLDDPCANLNSNVLAQMETKNIR
jgi:hypothetical protein